MPSIKENIRNIYRGLLPAALRRPIHAAKVFVADRLHPEMPPQRLREHISPLWLDFKASGRDQLEFCRELAGLKPSDRVLDVACGCGRFALPLTNYLSAQGSYEGFDVVPDVIQWCRDHIQVKYPKFRFAVADVATPWSPSSAFTSSTFRFPYQSEDFDFVYAGSLFTHLTEEGSRNYLRQVATVLKPGGRFVCTWLLFNSETSRFLPGRSFTKIWDEDHGSYRTKGGTYPELSVLYDEVRVRSWYAESGLRIAKPIRVDATYCPARIPDNRSEGMHLYYANCIIAEA